MRPHASSGWGGAPLVIDPDVFEPERTSYPDDEGVNHYAIGSKGEADWALRKLQKHRARMAENAQVVAEQVAALQAEISRLADWLVEANESDNQSAIYFEAILRNWHESQLEADPNDIDAWKKEPNKTIKLPSGGKLSITRVAPTVEINAETFLAENGRPELINETTTYKPIHANIKKAVLEDGEILPGVTVVPSKVTWKAVTE